MPPNLAQLLTVVTTLLGYGRHLAATIERRASLPGFALFAAMFGTAKLPVILAHLHRAILRAAALEALLRRRAATGRDIVVALTRLPATSAPRAGTQPHPVDEPIAAQAARLATERAAYDAPVNPDHLPTAEEIEAEVRRLPIGRTISAICRDLGIVPGLCTRVFWDSVLQAIDLYAGSSSKSLHDMNRKQDRFQQEQENAPAAEQIPEDNLLYLDQALGFKLGNPLVEFFPAAAPPRAPSDEVPLLQQFAAALAEATGPPPRAAVPRAA